MSSISETADVPEDSEITDEQREMLEWVRDNSNRLSEIAARMLQEESEEVSSS